VRTNQEISYEKTDHFSRIIFLVFVNPAVTAAEKKEPVILKSVLQ
jgi:hypothetical protein